METTKYITKVTDLINDAEAGRMPSRTKTFAELGTLLAAAAHRADDAREAFVAASEQAREYLQSLEIKSWHGLRLDIHGSALDKVPTLAVAYDCARENLRSITRVLISDSAAVSL